MTVRGYRRSWIQCQRKMKSLHKKYKEAKDSNKRSGSGRVTCPFYNELDRILGDKPSVQPLDLLDSCCAEEEQEEMSPSPAANTASSASADSGDGTLASLSTPASTSDESSSTRSEDTAFNSCASSTSTGSTSAKNRKRKSKLEATLEVFADKISTALKSEDADLLLKMQAAQHEHSSWRDQTTLHSNHFTILQCRPHSLTAQDSILLTIPQFPMTSAPSPTIAVSYLQDLSSPLHFNNAHPHAQNLPEPFFQTPADM
ncbi:PREDICTED: uncharacterized protein LOC106905736 [Poecilia mexicana]|uniref:uncharacterized protein LOC106905736 n=1 Tax=Poecilia mexicana TaxID=48701 RepID=UPI00072E5BA6|nr:PREDICTED: uncharacterized protein LOC106905736 [Poecilia mexicana]XP_016537093.1 PREDICTED: uncharacterized protein LOC107838621 [Poecilia formosa]